MFVQDLPAQTQYHPSFQLKLLVTTVIGEIIIIVATGVIITTGNAGEFSTSGCSFLLFSLLMSLSMLSKIHICSKTKKGVRNRKVEMVSLGQVPKLQISILSAVQQDFTLLVCLAIYNASYNTAHANFKLNICNLTVHIKAP